MICRGTGESKEAPIVQVWIPETEDNGNPPTRIRRMRALGMAREEEKGRRGRLWIMERFERAWTGQTYRPQLGVGVSSLTSAIEDSMQKRNNRILPTCLPLTHISLSSIPT